MNSFESFILWSIGLVVFSASSVRLGAQAPPTKIQTDSITLSIALDKDHVSVGQTPWVLVTINNQTNGDLYFSGNRYRLHVEGEGGEAPTTLRQRTTTGRFIPGESALRGDVTAQEVIPPKGSRTEKFRVKYFYDLSVPGKYAVYVDVLDPLSGKWLRTKTLTFQIQPVAQ